jgi:endoglucanase
MASPMHRFHAFRAGVALLMCMALASGGGGASAADNTSATPAALTLDSFPLSVAGKAPRASPQAWAVARQLGRGINFGNMLESPHEGDWGLRAEQRFINLVGPTGLTSSVRLPVRWSNHASSDARALIEPAFFARVDTVIDALLARGVTVILNMHHYRQLDGDALDPGERAVDANIVRVRMLAMWQQIAQRYATRSPRLLFEIYNEPHGTLEPQWNDLLSRALRVIRASNPTRLVVVGPTHWNSASRLAQLELPPDLHLLLTVHHYEPFEFTHQGASWVQPVKPTGVDCCDDAMLARMREPLDIAVRESARLSYPVFVGEFGAYEKASAAARVRYLRAMREEMAKRQLPWFYWELASGFGVYDLKSNSYRQELKDALFGP